MCQGPKFLSHNECYFQFTSNPFFCALTCVWNCNTYWCTIPCTSYLCYSKRNIADVQPSSLPCYCGANNWHSSLRSVCNDVCRNLTSRYKYNNLLYFQSLKFRNTKIKMTGTKQRKIITSLAACHD